jgi:hypothetical protein
MIQSRRTKSRRTTSRPIQRDTQEDLAARGLNSPQPSPTLSRDPLRATAQPSTPLSLQSGAGRQYWDEVLRLLVKIRAECDAAAERLGYASRKDDGLAAVEYIANKILEAVRGERQQQKAKKPSAARSSDVAQPSEGRNKSAGHESPQRPQPAQPPQPATPAQPASHSERSRLIGELKQMLRDGKTKAGVVVDPPLTHEIAKHITLLNEVTQPETAETLKQIRDSVARFFGKASVNRKAPSKVSAVAFQKSATGAKPQPSRAKKTVTKGSKRRSR